MPEPTFFERLIEAAKAKMDGKEHTPPKTKSFTMTLTPPTAKDVGESAIDVGKGFIGGHAYHIGESPEEISQAVRIVQSAGAKASPGNRAAAGDLAAGTAMTGGLGIAGTVINHLLAQHAKDVQQKKEELLSGN